MNLMVIGGGGREHAIIRALRKNPRVQTIWCLPGNGGIARDAQCVPIGAKDIPAITAFAREHPVDFAVVAQDDPLALGCVDALHALGVACFGPEAKAARIESSKVFAKTLMAKYRIPTARCEIFSDAQAALAYLETAPLPAVVKADGLALGKGVLIARTRDEARQAVRTLMQERKFGDAGSRVVIEEFLTGPEVSVLAFTDGKTVRPMVSSMDHKCAFDGDEGPNTGGMGAVAPNPYYTPAVAEQCMQTIFLPTVRAMAAEGCPFRGCLYFGLMLTPDGPKVIEYNCRFGDPETQAVLPLLKTDLLTVMQAVERGELDSVPVEWDAGASACVVLASGGYPGAYEKDKPIAIPAELPENITVYHAGDRLAGDTLVTAGGRVLGVTAVAPTLRRAVEDAYAAVDRIRFDGAFCRRDIGRRALAAGKEL